MRERSGCLRWLLGSNLAGVEVHLKVNVTVGVEGGLTTATAIAAAGPSSCVGNVSFDSPKG